MHIPQTHWQQIEEYLQHDDRCVLPLGSTEQHAFLSLSTDSILAEKVSLDAAVPLGVPVFPVLPYGITPYFMAYPGTVTLRVSTYLAVVSDILDSLYDHGFRRILIVNGHGGNNPAGAFADEWMNEHPEAAVKFHNWWNAPRTAARVALTDPVASHASWMENFPWTRLADVAMPAEPAPTLATPRKYNAAEMRERLGLGNFAGLYQRPDEEMLAIWAVAVMETRSLLENWDD
jgi:creatinine amidohydrolase